MYYCTCIHRPTRFPHLVNQQFPSRHTKYPCIPHTAKHTALHTHKHLSTNCYCNMFVPRLPRKSVYFRSLPLFLNIRCNITVFMQIVREIVSNTTSSPGNWKRSSITMVCSKALVFLTHLTTFLNVQLLYLIGVKYEIYAWYNVVCVLLQCRGDNFLGHI